MENFALGHVDLSGQPVDKGVNHVVGLGTNHLRAMDDNLTDQYKLTEDRRKKLSQKTRYLGE